MISTRHTLLIAVMIAFHAVSPTTAGAPPNSSTTSEDAIMFLQEAADGRVDLKTKDDYTRIGKVAQTLDMPHSLAFLEQMKARFENRTSATTDEEDVLDAVFGHVLHDSEERALPYFRFVPPQYVGAGGLEWYMGVLGRLDGIPNLFAFYREAKTPFARHQLFEVIKRAFHGLHISEADGDSGVAKLEAWYELHKSQLRIDKEYPTTGGRPRSKANPDDMIRIGIFLAPKTLLEESDK